MFAGTLNFAEHL